MAKNKRLVQTGMEIATELNQVADWDTMINSFLDTLKMGSTRQTYEPTLRSLAIELGGAGPAVVSGQDLGAWASGVRAAVESGELAPNTGKRRIMTVKSFFKFARLVGQSKLDKDMRSYLLQAPTDQVVKPFQVLSESEQGRLIEALDGQDRRIVATLLYAGLRVSELCKLNRRDYYSDEQGAPWMKVAGKGGKGRVVPVGAKLAAELGPTNGGGAGALFESRQGDGHYTRVRVFQVVKAAIAAASIDKRISPHSLRHTAAMSWLRSGVPVTVVQKWLGHSSLATTQKYLDHIENGEAHKMMP